MKKLLFYSLSILALSLTACKKDKEAFGVHTMTSTILVKQSGITTIKMHSGDKATAAATVRSGGVLELIINGKEDVFEQLNLIIDKPKSDYKGTYTLQSKDNANADVLVNYHRANASISNSYRSTNTAIEGSLEITGYDGTNKRQRISGTYRIVLKEVKSPDKAAASATEADISDVTITGTFKDAWLTL